MTALPHTSELRRIDGGQHGAAVLRRRAAELEAVFDALPDGLLIVDTEGQVVEANRAVIGLLGLRRKDEVLGPITQILRPRVTCLDGSPLALADLAGYRALRSGRVNRAEVRVEVAPNKRDRPSTTRVLELTASPVHDPDGSVVGAVIVTRDVTLERQRAHEAAFLAEAAELFDSSRDLGTTLTDFVERCVADFADWCSIDLYDDVAKVLRPAAAGHREAGAAAPFAAALRRRPLRVGEGFSGAAAAASSAHTLFDLTDAAIGRYARNAREATLIGRLGVQSLVAVPLRAESGLVGVLTVGSARPERRLDRQTVGLLHTVARRIAASVERERRAEGLAHALGRLETAFDSMADGVVILDKARRVVLTNAVVRRMFGLNADPVGWSEERLVRRTARCLEDPEQAKEMLRADQARRAASDGDRVAGDLHRLELRVARPRRCDLERVTTAMWGPADDEDDPDAERRDEVVGWVTLYRDVSHIRDAQRVKNEFVLGAGRELRQPLTAISAYAVQGLRKARQVQADRSIVRGLEVVLRNARQLTVLVGDLLEAERPDVARQDLVLAQLDVLALVAQAVDEARAVTTLHRLRVDAPVSMPAAHWDSDHVRQALINVLTNAIKYSPDGGQIGVRVRPHSDGVLVSVRDRGIGVSPDQLERIFERFYRVVDGPARQRVRGSGLGLHLVRTVVRAHGGAVWAESTGEPGQGTVVHLLLPWHAEV